MNRQDLFVAALTVLIGVACLLAAVGNSESFYKLRKVQWIESRWGRPAARWFYVVLGVCMLGLAAYIGAGR